MRKNFDFRDMVGPACDELRALRKEGLSVDEALDRMKGRGFSLPAVTRALRLAEGLEYSTIKRLLTRRGDWDEF